MYRSFRILEDSLPSFSSDDYKAGCSLWRDFGGHIESGLQKYLIEDDVLDAGKMMEDWFPKINADIFLSHSHKDEITTKYFSGWLLQNLGLRTFTDEQAWLYLDTATDKIDEVIKEKTTIGEYYKERDKILSNLHMLLMSSLAKMIDKTECFLFLESNQSVHFSDFDKKTFSPWIFEELMISGIVRSQRPRKPHHLTLNENSRIFDNVEFEYPAETSHLTLIDSSDIRRWLNIYRSTPNLKKSFNSSLDILYFITEE